MYSAESHIAEAVPQHCSFAISKSAKSHGIEHSMSDSRAKLELVPSHEAMTHGTLLDDSLPESMIAAGSAQMSILRPSKAATGPLSSQYLVAQHFAVSAIADDEVPQCAPTANETMDREREIIDKMDSPVQSDDACFALSSSTMGSAQLASTSPTRAVNGIVDAPLPQKLLLTDKPHGPDSECNEHDFEDQIVQKKSGTQSILPNEFGLYSKEHCSSDYTSITPSSVAVETPVRHRFVCGNTHSNKHVAVASPSLVLAASVADTTDNVAEVDTATSAECTVSHAQSKGIELDAWNRSEHRVIARFHPANHYHASVDEHASCRITQQKPGTKSCTTNLPTVPRNPITTENEQIVEKPLDAWSHLPERHAEQMRELTRANSTSSLPSRSSKGHTMPCSLNAERTQARHQLISRGFVPIACGMPVERHKGQAPSNGLPYTTSDTPRIDDSLVFGKPRSRDGLPLAPIKVASEHALGNCSEPAITCLRASAIRSLTTSVSDPKLMLGRGFVVTPIRTSVGCTHEEDVLGGKPSKMPASHIGRLRKIRQRRALHGDGLDDLTSFKTLKSHDNEAILHESTSAAKLIVC